MQEAFCIKFAKRNRPRHNLYLFTFLYVYSRKECEDHACSLQSNCYQSQQSESGAQSPEVEQRDNGMGAAIKDDEKYPVSLVLLCYTHFPD